MLLEKTHKWEKFYIPITSGMKNTYTVLQKKYTTQPLLIILTVVISGSVITEYIRHWKVV